jgi:hypothetical protein
MTNEEINLAVAAIAGWTEIELWNTRSPFGLEDKSPNPLRVYQGTNAAHPELGKFIPKYVESLDAITWVFRALRIYYRVNYDPDLCGCEVASHAYTLSSHEALAETEPLALCKLLLLINPAPIAPPQVAIIDDDGEIETVFEAEFV